MRPLARRVAALSLLAASALAFHAPSAYAQSDADKATARELGQEGQAALDKKDFKTAEDRFKRADALYHAPTLALGYARASAANGHIVNASETYNRIIREGVPPGAPAPFVKAVEDAKAEVGAVQARIASVTIIVQGPDSPKVTLDDQPVPVAALGVKRQVDPGAHVVKASADGWEPGETKFTVADAASTSTTITLKKSATPVAPVAVVAPPPGNGASPAATTDQPPPSSSGSSMRTLGWVGVGVGGAALVVGGVTGFLALGKHSDLSKECQNGVCPASAQSDLDSFHSMGTISTIGFIAGAVLAGGGAVLILTSPKSSEAPPQSASITPFIGPGSVGAVGTF